MNRNCFAALAITALLSGTVASGGDLQSAIAPAYTYQGTDGARYAAVGLQAPANAKPAVVRQHIILVDTSASQSGEFRRQALSIARSLVESFSEEEDAALWAIDSKVTDLSRGFLPGGSEEWSSALGKLEKRTPLGATRLLAGLDRALESIQGETGSIIYIGDGMSTADIIEVEAFRDVIKSLVKRQIAFHGYAVGPTQDRMLLGALTLHTGGTLLLDRPISVGTDQTVLPEPAGVASELLGAARKAPIYMKALTADKKAEILPANAPLRADRATYFLVRSKGELPANINATDGDVAWKLSDTKDVQRQAFVAAMWRRAAADKGLSVPLAGDELLTVARDEFTSQMNSIANLGQEAADQGNWEQVQEAAVTLRQNDQDHPAVGELFAKLQTEGVEGETEAQPEPATETESKTEAPAPAEQPAADPNEVDDTNKTPQENPEPRPGTLLQQQEEEVRIRTEKMVSEVNKVIDWIRETSDTEPEAALEELKRQINVLAADLDIDPDIRDQLRARLENLRLEVSSKAETIRLRKLQSERQKAVIESVARLRDETQIDDEKIERLIDEVRALISRGIRGDAEAFQGAEAVARSVLELRPDSHEGTAALFVSEAHTQLDVSRRLRSLRADKFLETLHQVELSHVAFPDEPPIVWPAPEVWADLTERRRKWKSVDLKRYNKIEERIRIELDKPTNFDFIDQPLRDVIGTIKDLHGIEIILQEQKLTDAGVQPDTPVTMNLSGISLRSGLKLMLEPLQLTYVIEDEVMKILPATDAILKLSTRVYPVGDLVISVNAQTLQQGGGGLGGGLGGGQGGLGGQQGGIGGGQQGGFGGGIGFMVPPEKLDDAPLKKKQHQAQ